MEIVNLDDARTRLVEWVDKAASGEDVVIGRNGRPLVRITRLDAPKRPIRFGLMKGRLRVPTGFDSPLPDDTRAGFEGP